MACALIPSRSNKRRIDCVEENDFERQASPSACKRLSNDFILSPASFGSQSGFRAGRVSPNCRDTGRSSPSTALTKPPSPRGFSDSHISPGKPFGHVAQVIHSLDAKESSSSCSDNEDRFTVEEAFELCRFELLNQDNNLKQEYDQALQEKLAEQYQSFIQFAQDQLQTNMQGPPPDMEMTYVG